MVSVLKSRLGRPDLRPIASARCDFERYERQKEIHTAVTLSESRRKRRDEETASKMRKIKEFSYLWDTKKRFSRAYGAFKFSSVYSQTFFSLWFRIRCPSIFKDIYGSTS